MKNVYLIRHGQSVNNAMGAGRDYQGADDPLNETGKKQAQYIAKRACKLPLEALIASTMTRAQETAEAISHATGLPIESSAEFTERLPPTKIVGRPEGDRDAVAMHDAWTETLFGAEGKIEDGENFADIKARCERALSLLESRKESHIAVVTHGFFLRMIAARVVFGEDLTAREFARFVTGYRSNNTGITHIQSAPTDLWSPWAYPGQKWIVRSWNDRAHLG